MPLWLQTAAMGQKKAKTAAAAAKRRLPFVLTNYQQMEVARTLERIREEGHIPRGWYTVNLHHCFAHPSYLKAHDWLLLAGPIGKYVLQVSRQSSLCRFSFEPAICMHLSPTSLKQRAPMYVLKCHESIAYSQH